MEDEKLIQDVYNKETPKVSVIMAVYNTTEDCLRAAIESILNQTYKNFELITIDDGSTTNVKDVITSYVDERIKYIRQENQGAAGSRNNAIKVAKGEYIAIMDSDDISLPERLEKEVEFLDTHSEYSVVGSWAEVFPAKKMVKVVEEPKILDLIKECPFIHSTTMYKRKLFFENNYEYDLNMPPTEDYHFWSKVIRTEKTYNFQFPLVKYRIEGQGISSTKKEIGEINTIKIQKELLSYLTTDKQLQNKITDLIYKNTSITSNIIEKLFSVKNFRKLDKKYKIITILGFKISILVKRYKY